jgi:CrcB protein
VSAHAALLLVGAGGFAGAALRYLVNLLAYRGLPPGFPFATFVVNVTGCFAMGLFAAWFDRQGAGPAARLFCLTGVLGGYTTFSAFAFETLALARGGSVAAAVANAGGQVLVGLCALALGAATARASA